MRKALLISGLAFSTVGLNSVLWAETGRWPISNSLANTADVVTSAYGPRYVSSTRPYDIHEGIDIRTWVDGQPGSVPVYPWKSGIVEDKGYANSGGYWVKITHPENGVRTGYYRVVAQ